MYKPDLPAGKREIMGRDFIKMVCEIYHLPYDMVQDVAIDSAHDDVVRIHVSIIADKKLLNIEESAKKASE